MNLGENLRHIRETRQISRQALADELNLSYSSICKYERGSRTPDYGSLVKMAHVFQVSIEELLATQSKENASVYPVIDPPADTACEQPDIYAKDDEEADEAEVSALSDDESYLLMLYRGLDPRRRAAVRELLEPISNPELARAESVRQAESAKQAECSKRKRKNTSV